MNIDPPAFNYTNLPSLPLKHRKALPSIPAIYLAIDSNKIVHYIGRTQDLKQRWINHHRDQDLEKFPQVEIVWLEVSDLDLLPEIEESLVRWFEPSLNEAPVFNPVPKTLEESNRVLTLEKQMLRWKLREVMARAKLTNREVAHEMEVHETSVSRLKTADTMPRIDGNTLDNLCNSLTKLYRKKGIKKTIMPADLFEYVPEDIKNE